MTVYTLWSAPRARSTAFFVSMAERGDMLALHEPFWNLQAFGAVDVDGRRFDSFKPLLEWLRNETREIRVFLKETTDHRFGEILADESFLAEARHAFLIRRPEEIVASYYALWPEMRRDEVGLETMYELHAAVADVSGQQPIVIDSDDLVARPEATMASYCAAIDLRFIPEALSWEPGERQEWHRSAPWHVDVSASSSFQERNRAYAHTVENSPELARFAAHHRPFYDQLWERRLQIADPGSTENS